MQIPVIYLVDDDDSFRLALTRLLEITGYRVRAFRSAGEFLLTELEDEPGCILLDYRLPGPNGLEIQESLHKRMTFLPTIFLSGVADISTAVQAMKGGAVDFLTKPVIQHELLACIKKALALQAQQHQKQEQLQDWVMKLQTLTPREIEVFKLVVTGKLNKEIADKIGASERTIKAHRASIMSKMQVSSLAELVQISVHIENMDDSGLPLITSIQ